MTAKIAWAAKDAKWESHRFVIGGVEMLMAMTPNGWSPQNVPQKETIVWFETGDAGLVDDDWSELAPTMTVRLECPQIGFAVQTEYELGRGSYGHAFIADPIEQHTLLGAGELTFICTVSEPHVVDEDDEDDDEEDEDEDEDASEDDEEEEDAEDEY